MMTDEEAKRCPLCAEEMDWTDQQLKPCECSYQVCVWCWHQIMDMAEKDGTEGRCPACRSPYDKGKIVGMEANFERVAANANRKHKPLKAKSKTNEGKDLSNVRAIQRRMAYVIGLPLSLADEDLLKQKEFFGQYGKVCKISLSRTAGGEIQQFVNDSCSVYITFSKEEEAVRCIQSVHEFVLEGRFLRASFGTAKYCHAWLRNVPCNNPSCLYLHSLGAEEDNFGKDEEAAVITRSRVQQIVGATNNLHRRSGNVLPPPVDEPLNYNSASIEKPIKSDQKDVPRDMETLSGQLTCSHSSKDKDGPVKAPNKGTFVDIVGRSSSSSPEKDGNVAEDMRVANLCSEVSSIDIHKDNHVEVSVPDAMLHSNGFFSDNDFKEQYRQPSKENSGSKLDSRNPTSHGPYITVNDDRLKDSGSLSREGPILPSSYPLKTSEYSSNYVHEESCNLSDYNVRLNTVHNNKDEASLACSNLKSDGYNENKFQSSAKSDMVYRSSKSFSNEEIVEHLRRLNDDERIYDAQNPNLEAVEKSIISNIMSLGLDADLSTLRPVAGLFDHTERRHGSSWNIYNNDRSMISFGNREGFANQLTCLESSFSERGQDFRFSLPKDSGESKERYSCKPLYLGSNAEVPIPPGYSLPARDPPPGFSAYDRTDQVFHANANSGSGIVKCNSFSRNHYQTPPTGNSSNISDIDLMDPAIMSVGNGNPLNGLSNSCFDIRSHSSSQPSALDDEARSWLLNLLMQQSTPAHQYMKYAQAQTYMQQAPPSHEDPIYSGQIGNGYSWNDMYSRLSSKYSGQLQQSSNTSLSQQKLENGPFTNGYQPCLDGIQLRNELGRAKLQSNEKLGFNKFYSGYGDYILQPCSDDLYTRVFGM